VQVPLSGTAAGAVDLNLPSSNHGLLPSTHLTPKTILGGGGEERETLGHLYAAQLASHLSLVSPNEHRILVVGFGLLKTDPDRETFFDMVDLARKVL
jgi:proteasome assembly chaperone 3